MSTSASDVARAAVAALAEALEQQGQSASPRELRSLLLQAIDDRAGSITVTIATPTGDAGPLAAAAGEAIRAKTGKVVAVEQVADPSMVGGAVISYGDERIDLSIRRGLDDAELFLSPST